MGTPPPPPPPSFYRLVGGIRYTLQYVLDPVHCGKIVLFLISGHSAVTAGDDGQRRKELGICQVKSVPHETIHTLLQI
jgi:hypothetical protein